VDPDYNFTAGEFCRRADGAVKEIAAKGKYPVFVGGTGLYIDSFFKGMSQMPEVPSEVRKAVAEMSDFQGMDAMYLRLQEVDPDYAARIHQNDSQRILRALEVFEASGKPISFFHSGKDSRESEDTLYIGLLWDREKLRRRIDQRVDEMVRDGFFDEVEGLRGMGYSSELKSMKSIGYNEINSYFDGQCSKEEAVEKIKTVTKKYAKRQMTWFRKNKKVNWFGSDEIDRVFDKLYLWEKEGGGTNGEATE